MSIARKILMGAAGAGSKTTYIDDLFSTYLYRGDGTNSHQIVNGIDLASKGGLIWGKERSNSGSHYQFDTVRGLNKRLKSNTSGAQETDTFYSSVNSDGYTIEKTTSVNISGRDYVSWTFRKEPAFFDVVTFTSTSDANQRIPHSLACLPGLIICKCISTTGYWVVYHTEIAAMNPSDPWTKSILLDSDVGSSTYASGTWGTGPTSTDFGFKGSAFAGAGEDWIAYVFAGGKSTAATARSVDFDSNQDVLNTSSSSDYAMGTGDYTVECWVKINSTNNNFGIFQGGGINTSYLTGPTVFYYVGSGLTFGNGAEKGTGVHPPIKQWFHIALVKNGSSTTFYYNGTPVRTVSDTHNYTNQSFALGGYYSNSYLGQIQISNFRVVKGTAVYTSGFNPPKAGLTNITNTKLLCCNNASVTGYTVAAGALSTSGDPPASTASPFIDSDVFKFGEDEDQDLVKCGSYRGNGQSTGSNEVNLGWEPQWILVKCESGSEHWEIYDSARGIFDGSTESCLEPNLTNAESQNDRFSVTPTGFKITSSSGAVNGNGHTYLYVCIRRPDNIVGKPVEAANGAYNAIYGNSSSIIPNFPSNFRVDMGIYKEPTNSYDWYLHTRLMGPYNLKTNSNDTQKPAAPGDADATFDSPTGWGKFGYNTDKASWMWKRHAGFDVVTYKGYEFGGVNSNRSLRHSLRVVPEMIWMKARNYSGNWAVYHKGLNGGTNPWNYYMNLNGTGGESSSSTVWGQTAPTSDFWTVGPDNAGNGTYNYCAYLFASVDGISKVGSYTGNGSASGPTITLGFAPRFILIKCTTGGTNWMLYDTLRGLTSGNDQRIELNTGSNQTAVDDIDPTATGFQVVSTWDQLNGNTENYLYYAHA